VSAVHRSRPLSEVKRKALDSRMGKVGQITRGSMT